MPTAPLTPAAPATQVATTIATPAIAPNPPAQTQQTAAAPKPPAATGSTYQGPSPLQQVRRTSRSTPYSESVSLRFLTGPYKGQKMDVGQWLGLIVPEVSHRLSSEWESTGGDKIQNASNFTKLGDRTYSFSIYLWDQQFDISHLAENIVAHLREIGEQESTPPLLMLRQGDLVARPIFCTSGDVRYSQPFSSKTGYQQAEVSLSFTLQAGKNTDNSLGQAQTSTPLQDWKARTTQSQREKQAAQAVAETLLEPCLGADGSQQVQALLDERKFADAAAVNTLSADAFVQVAIAGMIPAEVLKDPTIQAKLRNDLAFVLAKNEDGIGAVDGASPRRFAEAILNADAGRVLPSLQQQAQTAIADFALINKAVQEQTLDEGADVFNRDLNPTATNRFLKLGSCGITMRKVGATAAGQPSQADTQTLAALQTFFKTNPTNAQVKEKFGLTTESQAGTLKNGSPYTSKDQFLQVAARLGSGVSGYALFNKAAAATTPTSTAVPAP